MLKKQLILVLHNSRKCSFSLQAIGLIGSDSLSVCAKKKLYSWSFELGTACAFMDVFMWQNDGESASVRISFFRMPGSQAGVFGGNALFLFFITRLGGCARWLPIGSSYPLDDVYGALPSAAEHTALKEAFFQPKGKSSTGWDPALSLAPTPSPSPTSSFLPCFPWPWSKCFMWPGWGRSEVDPRPLSSEETCFSAGRERVGVGRVEQWGGGVHLFGGWVESSHGRGGNKRAGALSHAPVLACMHL